MDIYLHFGEQLTIIVNYLLISNINVNVFMVIMIKLLVYDNCRFEHSRWEFWKRKINTTGCSDQSG